MRNVIHSKWAWVYLIVIACLTFTIIPGWISIARKEWLFLVIGTIITGLIYVDYFTCKGFVCLAIYFVVLFFNAKLGDAAFNSMPIIIYEVLQFLVPSAICFYAYKYGNESFMKVVVLLVFAIICIESVASYFINLSFPGIIRNLESLTREEGDRSFAYSFMKLGLANYSFTHALPIIISPLICLLKDKTTKYKWMLIITLLLSCLLIYISSSGTSFFLMVLMIILGIITNLKGLSRNIIVLAVSIVCFSPFIFSQSIQIATFDVLERMVPEESLIGSKLEAIKLSIQSEKAESDVEARVTRYRKSIDGFTENMLLGSNDKLGGHSAFLDRLGNLGLIGFIPLFLFILMQVRNTMPYIPDRHKAFYLEGIIAAMLMFGLKAVGLWGILLLSFVVLPFMLTEKDKL